MKIVGLDLSINSSAAVKFDMDKNFCISGTTYLGFTTVKKKWFGSIVFYKKDDFSYYIEQNVFMLDKLLSFCGDAEYIAIEDYAYAASGRVFHIAEFAGLVKTNLYWKKANLRLYDPPTIKMFATGKGNADKRKMINAFDSSFPLFDDRPNLDFLIDLKFPNSRYDNPREDIVDAYFIAKLLRKELMLKNGKEILSKNKKDIDHRIFTKKSKSNPIPLLEREFICKI